MGKFFVIDTNTGNTSYNDTAEKGDSFDTIDAAIERAADLALTEPGNTFLICQAVKSVVCNVSEPFVETVV